MRHRKKWPKDGSVDFILEISIFLSRALLEKVERLRLKSLWKLWAAMVSSKSWPSINKQRFWAIWRNLTTQYPRILQKNLVDRIFICKIHKRFIMGDQKRIRYENDVQIRNKYKKYTW